MKRENCDKFQTHQSNTDDNKRSEQSDRITDTNPLKNPRKSYDSKKQKNQKIQRLTIQALKKAPLGDILLKGIQPSLSKREWIINQRHISHEKPKIYTTKDKSKSDSKSFEFEKTKIYREKKWRNKKENKNRESRVKILKVKGFDKNNEDKQKMRRKREGISEKDRKLVQKSKHWQAYEEDKDNRSVSSSDSEIYLTGLTLIGSKRK